MAHQPGGQEVEVVGAGEVDGQPAVGGAQEPGRASAADVAGPAEAGQRRPLSEETEDVDFDR